MNFLKRIFITLFLIITTSISAQQTEIYTNQFVEYNNAIALFQSKSFAAAQEKFVHLKEHVPSTSDLKANCEFYIATCAVRLGQPNADNLMQKFVDDYPTSTKRNSAFINVANYYYKIAKYPYAAKWYSKVNTTNLSLKDEETFNFNYGYSLFSTKNYSKAKEYFLTLLDSQKYGAQAKYYYGYIAYNQDDFDTADKYLSEVENNTSFNKNVSYYLADMNFKLGNFQKAVDYGIPLLKTAKRVEHSEISKIVGESYFNLKDYQSAIPHLLNYKGKRGKFNNTDYYLIGYSNYKQNEFENAIKHFNKIIDGNNSVAQNAYYHLAECYLKLDEKQAALNAFRNAAQMKFEPEIKKDAWLNYAKLSYEIGNPYKSVPEVLQEYLALYPNSAHKFEIEDLIVSSYISSKDYEGAIKLLENKKSEKDRTLYQKVALLRGIELFNETKFSEANNFFKIASTINNNETVRSRALFWLAETNYRLNNYLEAIEQYKAFAFSNNATNTNEYKEYNYNLAYAYFKQKDFEKATTEFLRFIQNNPTTTLKQTDSYLRIGDGYFVTKNYNKAISYYNKVVNSKSTEKDYAQFQKAICYGLTGNESAKIKELNSFLKTYKKSTYLDDALFVLGNSYIKTSKNELAINSFNTLINSYKNSTLTSKAMLKKGLIYYNTDKNEQAITTYKSVVQKYPNTSEAIQAAKDLRKIYVDLGRVDEYATWVKNIDFIDVSNTELDNDMFESAERQYLQNNHKRAISAFEKYLVNFKNGLHKLKANYYLAESLIAEGSAQKALPYYTFVIGQEQNEYTENALYQLSVIYLEDNNWPKAIPVLERLENESNKIQNTTFAQSNLMKGYFEQKEYSKASNYGNKVLSHTKIEDRIKSDAYVFIARSAIETNELQKAREAYVEVNKIATGKLKAEALYYQAYFENDDGSYRVSNEIVQDIAANYAAYKYWAAKSLVLMAKNYSHLNDAYQATYILESVIKNFEQFDDVVTDAKSTLSQIKEDQAKTNESIKQ